MAASRRRPARYALSRTSISGGSHGSTIGISTSEHMSPAMSTPVSGRNTAPWPDAWPSCTITSATGPSHGMFAANSGATTPISPRSWPGADSSAPAASSSRSRLAIAVACGVA